MRYATPYLLILSATNLPTLLANPLPDPQILCTTWSDYKITSQKDLPGPSQQGSYSVSGASGTASLSQQTSYEVGVTIEVGADIGLNLGEVVSAGLSGSVSKTTTKGSVNGAGDTCPKGGWSCSLAITPTMVKVSGTVTPRNSCIEGSAGPEKPYTVTFPKTGSDGTPFLNVQMCTCHNLEHWAAPGHPALLCPGDCALP